MKDTCSLLPLHGKWGRRTKRTAIKKKKRKRPCRSVSLNKLDARISLSNEYIYGIGVHVWITLICHLSSGSCVFVQPCAV